MNFFLLNIFFAFIGGFVMNFMPCILPLISLKISGFLHDSNCKSSFIRKNLSYIGGVLSFFLVFAVILMIIKSSGAQVIMGVQMQSGVFLLTIFTILLLIGFNLSGLYEINFSGVVSATGELENKFHKTKITDFLNGFFVSLLAVPCTAPFISTALAYGLAAGNTKLFFVIMFMGLGFAFPFFCAIFFSEKILKIMPRPGAWMIKFKELLAFPVYGTAGWIFFVLIKQNQYYYSSVAIFILLFLLFFFWFYQNFEKMKAIYKIIILGSVLAFGLSILPQDHLVGSQIEYGKKVAFSNEKLDEALANGQKILVTVSASWCVTCNVNEKNAMSSDKFYDALKKNDILYLYADMTNDNNEANLLLQKYGRSGIPFYILVSSDGTEEFLPQLLTENFVLDKLNSLK